MTNKMLLYIRHAPEVGKYIGQDGLHKTLETVYRFIGITNAFHGPRVSTAQTLLPVMAWGGKIIHVHPVIKNIGTDEWLAEMKTDSFCDATKDGHTNLEALDIAHSAEQVLTWKENAVAGVWEMFNAMPDGTMGLAIGHDPIINLAAREFGLEVRTIEPLEGVIFELNGTRILASFLSL